MNTALGARALLEIIPDQSLRSRSVLLHDLLRDLISVELGDASVSMHQALLDVYRTTCTGAGWHTAHDDGYLYDHLAYHLSEGGMGDDLKELFADQRWLQVRVCQADYLYDGYLEDLMLIWKLAATQARQQIEANQEPGALGDCMRYLLICSSINSLAGNYVSELLVRAVEVGLWSTERALSVAVKIPEATKRAKMYTELLGTGKLRQEQLEDAQRLAVEAAQNIEDDEKRALALAALAPQLTEEPRHRTLERGLETVLALSEGSQERALVALGPYLTGELLERGLEIALGLDEEWQPAILAALVPRLTGELRHRTLERGLETAAMLENGWTKARVLAALAPQLTGEHLARALEIALPGDMKLYRGRALAAVGPYLERELLEQALAAALELSSYQQERAWALVALAPRLTEERRQQLLEREVENTVGLWNVKMRMTQVEILAALIPHVTGELLVKALKQGLVDVETMGVEGSPGKALVALAPYLTGDLLERALEAALALPGEEEEQVGLELHKVSPRAELLFALAPRLTSELLERALEAALALPDEWYQAAVLKALAPRLTGELLERALEAALALSGVWTRAEALEALAPYLMGEQLERALKAALALPKAWARAEALGAFLPLVSDQTLLLLPIRAAMIDTMLSITHWPRRTVLREFFVKNLFAPPILAPETLSAIASHIVEICKEWQWL